MTGGNPAHPDALAEQGFALLGAGDPRGAARAFRAAIAADDRHVEAHYGLLRALREAGQLQRSIGVALALTVLTPLDPRAHAALAAALRQAGQDREAETAVARARALEWKRALDGDGIDPLRERDRSS